MNIKPAFKKLFIGISFIAILLTLYAKSFDDVERICTDHFSSEVYLLNYVTKDDLKKIVTEHNENLTATTFDKRVYILNFIFEPPEPSFWDTKIDYKKKGCEIIDNMDIFCVVRNRKLENGTIEPWYNFME